MNINEILGDYDTRYFGAGHKNTEYLIKEIYKKDANSYQANATVNISKKSWSIKDGKIMKAHLSTIDALVLSCLMVEKALTDIDFDKFYVHKFVIKAGSSAIENLSKILITLKILKINDKQINCQVNVSQMKVKLVLKLSSNLSLGQLGENNYISNHFKDSILEINNVHLPIEFSMDPDGHRPVSEKYRTLSDREIIKSFKELGFNPFIVNGSIQQRLEKIVQYYDLSVVMDVDEAVEKAQEQIKTNREAVSKKIIEQYHEPTLKEKIKLMTKY